jgi:hypothetical protein
MFVGVIGQAWGCGVFRPRPRLIVQYALRSGDQGAHRRPLDPASLSLGSVVVRLINKSNPRAANVAYK